MNAFSNPQMIAEKALLRLENNLVIAGLINREYDGQFNATGTKKGVSINIRVPAQYEGREGQEAQIEGITDPTVPLKIDTQYGVDLGYSSQQEALNLEDYDEQVLDPATSRIAHYVDSKIFEAAYLDVPNHVGTPGTNPNSIDTYIDAGTVLNDNAVPGPGLRRVVINPRMEGAVIKGEKNRFNKQSSVGGMLTTGHLGHEVGFDFYMAQGVKSHTIGNYAGTPVTNALTAQVGTSLVTDGWTGSTGLKRGDVFTIAGVVALNKETKDSTGQLRQFVVSADCNPSGGNMTISFLPEIVTAGAYRNCTNGAADNQTITLFGAANQRAAQGLAFHRDFMTMAMVDLYVPKGVDMAGRANSKKRNLSIRFVRFWDGRSDQIITRLDILFGLKVLRPEMAVRVSGA
jgi:hypothetical protein